MMRGSMVAVAGAALAGGTLLGRAAKKRFGPEPKPAAVPYGKGERIEKFATIARDVASVYAAWRDYERLALVMPNVKRVEDLGGATRWTVEGPGNREVSWTAETIADVPGERVSWRADDAPVPHAGTVTFAPAPGGRGTEVTVEIEFAPPAGSLGKLLVKSATLPPQRSIEIDLRRFKSMLEAGDVALNGTDVKA